MATFFMFGKYTSDSALKISSERTQRAVSAIKNCGGEVKEIYALLGDIDVAIITDFPDVESALKASLSVARLTGLSFNTMPAVTAQKLDQIASSV